MRRRNLLLVPAAIGLLLLAFALVLLRLHEPTYLGKTLAQWAYQYRRDPSPEQAEEAGLAIHILCTNSVPALVEALAYDSAPRTEGFRARLQRLPAWFQHWLYRTFPDRRELRAAVAVTALEAMEDEAAPAIPGLMELAHTTNAMVSLRALWTLSRLGTNGLAALLTTVSDPRFPSRLQAFDAIASMRYLGTNAHIAVPVLVRLTREDDPFTTVAAVRVLGCLAIEPETSVPALAAGLTNPSPQVRPAAAVALGQFGPQARPAVSALLGATQDLAPNTRPAALAALRIIAPEILTNAPED